MAVMKWNRVRDIHKEAAAAFATTAESVAPDAWLEPIGEKKWSPAEIVEHLNCAYDVLTRELEGGQGMVVKTTAWQRLMLRLFLVPKLLRGGGFPKNARAPRELRPAAANPDQAKAVADFRERAARFEIAAMQADARGGGLTHAYFGYAPVADGALLCARHIRHHHEQLASLGVRRP